MKHSDFAIGEIIRCGGHQWRCTDVGTRTVLAIRIDQVNVSGTRPELHRTLNLPLSGPELALANGRPGLGTQVYCALQIGYFKAKHAFFRFTWDDAQADCRFVLTRYFNDQLFHAQAISKHEHYAQRAIIAELFGYRLWSADCLAQLARQAAAIVRRDVTPGFIVAELIAYLNEHKIVRPGYTTLQTLISTALSAERQRLGGLLTGMLDDASRKMVAQLLAHDDTLSELAALKQMPRTSSGTRWRTNGRSVSSWSRCT